MRVLVLLAVLFAVLWQPLHPENGFQKRSNTIQRVLLLTAHPDDECMFFAPTILSLAHYKSLFSLCLSIGDAEGLGHLRRRELHESLDILGIGKNKRWVIDHPNLKDNITAAWQPTVVARVVAPYILEHKIDVILTFDRGGISGHPNHVSLPAGARELIAQLGDQAPRLFTLETLPTILKYTGILAPMLAKLTSIATRVLRHAPFLSVSAIRSLGLEVPSLPECKYQQEINLTYISGAKEYIVALNAMRAHASQLVWFRWLYVLFSQYMWTNKWVEVEI